MRKGVLILSNARRVSRHKKAGVAPVLILIAGVVFVSALSAAVWQLLTPNQSRLSPIDLDPQLLEGPVAVLDEAGGNMPVLPPAVASLPEPVHPDQSDPSSGRVGNDYFSDAAFVGDSITTGIKIYDIMSNADVFAETGLGLHNIMTRECIKRGDTKVTILDALAQTNPKKIYVMLGGNSLGTYEQDALAAYANFVRAIRKQHPDSILYIQSVLPIHEPTYQKQYRNSLTNEKIRSFNALLQTLCTEEGYIYLDVASVFVDEQGAMPSQYTPDGVHINSAQYIMWFDYLKKHTAQ